MLLLTLVHHWSVLKYGNSGAIVYHPDSRLPDKGCRFGVDCEYGMFGLTVNDRPPGDGDESYDNEHSGHNSSGLGSGM